MALGKQIAVSLLLAAMLVAGWWWLSIRQGPATAQAPSERHSAETLVYVEALSLEQDRVSLRAVGSGEALRSAALHPAVDGEVVEVLFSAEQRVEKGTPLLRLDDEHERLAVRLAEVAEAEARRHVARYEKLAPSGTVSTVTLQSAQAELQSASLRLEQAKAALRDRTLYAPFTGIIGLSEIDPGDRVTDETLVATLDDRSSIEVDFTVPEEYAGRLAVGDPISVRPWTMPDKVLRGEISATDSRINAATRSLRVKARIPNPGETIRPGTSFDVRLEFTGGMYPSVREVAILWSRDGAYLWRITSGRAEKVFVTMVRRGSGRVLVDGALQAGEMVVVEGVQGLRQGQAVDPRPYGKDSADRNPAVTVAGAV